MSTLLLSAWFPTTPGALYRAYLSSDEHTAMTGGAADIAPREGRPFSAWDGYIDGAILDLEPGKRILSSWRTADFQDDDGDSLVEIALVAEEGGTRLWLHHTEIPRSQGNRYQSGWEDFYFRPMTDYFAAYLDR